MERHGSACGPVIIPVFKTGGRQVFLSLVGSTPTRFRHLSTWIPEAAGNTYDLKCNQWDR